MCREIRPTGLFLKNAVGIAAGVLVDDTALGIAGVAVDAADLHRRGIVRGDVTVSQSNGIVGRNCVDLSASQVALLFELSGRMPGVADDPFPRLLLGRGILNALQSLGHRLNVIELDPDGAFPGLHGMVVGIVQAWDHGLSPKIDHLSLGPDERLHVSLAADREELAVHHCHGGDDR